MKHEYYMKEALKEAELAYSKNEVPVGCVIVYNDEIIARTHNLRESLNKALAHAEVLAIDEANRKLQTWRLDSCTLYVTIEPCPMCSGAIIQSRISNVIYGAKDYKAGMHSSISNMFELPLNHKVDIQGGVLEKESEMLMKKFFKELRKK